MLICDCGWTGVNLVPDHVNNKARCPKCGTAHALFKAADAQLVTPADEAELIQGFNQGVVLGEVAFAAPPRS